MEISTIFRLSWTKVVLRWELSRNFLRCRMHRRGGCIDCTNHCVEVDRPQVVARYILENAPLGCTPVCILYTSPHLGDLFCFFRFLPFFCTMAEGKNHTYVLVSGNSSDTTKNKCSMFLFSFKHVNPILFCFLFFPFAAIFKPRQEGEKCTRFIARNEMDTILR